MSTPRKTSMTDDPNQPRFLNTVAHGQTKSSSMSKMMKKMAMVENLMAKRPSGSATGSLPHSKGSIFTREGGHREHHQNRNVFHLGSGGERPPLLPRSPPSPRFECTCALVVGRRGVPP